MTLSVSLMRLPVLLAALVLGACDAATAPLSIPVGRYEAVRYDGALLADARICGVLSVATSTLVLETGGRAAYSVHYRLAGQPDQVFSGTGSAREANGMLDVRVRGTWSHALENGAITELFRFDIVGAELHRQQGAECDAPGALEYERDA